MTLLYNKNLFCAPFPTPDDHWKNVRSIVSPAFSSGKVRRMYPCVARSVTNLVRRLKESSESGELVELKDALSRYSMDVITGAGFGVETNSHEVL